MMKTRKLLISLAVFVLAFFAALVFGVFSTSGSTVTADEMISIRLTSENEERLPLYSGTRTEYAAIYAATDGLTKDAELAEKLPSLFREFGVTNLRCRADSIVPDESEYEILIGVTDRQVSKDLYDDLLSRLASDDDVAFSCATMGKKVVVVANCDEALMLAEEFVLPYLIENECTVGSDFNAVSILTRAEYDKLMQDREDAMREEIINELIAKNEALKSEKIFNGYKRVFDKNRNQVVYGRFVEYVYDPYKSMLGDNLDEAWNTESLYPSPWVYPTPNQHPRYLLTENDVDRIREMMDDPEYAPLFEKLWYWAEFDIQDGIFPEKTGKSGKTYRYQEDILAGISARALAYLITGDEIYAYEAIVGIKNVMVTIEYTSDIHMDIYHGASHAMVVLAAVYDWCYPVLDETDKWDMIEGAVNSLWPSMEFNYPPVKPQEGNYNGISGHGTGPQFLRDYMSLAVAFYDEAPDWYEMVVGRYFYEYLTVANEQYINGWISQGTATYAPIKLMVQLWSANLLCVCTGENFFTEDAALSIQLFVSQLQPNEKYFQTGDGGRNPYGATPGFAEYFVSAALFNDPVAAAWAKYFSDDYTKYNYGSIFTMTPDLQLVFLSRVKEQSDEDKHEMVGLVQYFLDPAGQMTARNSWESDAATVFMKIGNMSMSNHDVYEHGTFQIYYKGLLAADSGSYKHYGGDSHYYYLQCTVAHNGLLIFNPSKAAAADLGSEIIKCKYPGTFCDHEPCEVVTDENGVETVNCKRPNKTCDHRGCETVYDVKNPSSYYYSGSQHRLPSPSSLVQWQDGSYRMAETMGADWGYNYDGSTKYAYIAGDITDAYDDVTVEYVGRRMLTLYTGREDVPMIFITFDEMESDKDYFEKTFLLHTIKEPEVDAENMTATVTSDEGGKLVLHSLFGAKVIEKIGGEGKAYWINGYFSDPNDLGSWDEETQSFTDENDKGSWVEGKNCLDEYTLDDNYMNIWGRVQLRTGSTTREKTTGMLTAMYVTDAESTAAPEISKYKSDYGYVAVVDDNIAMFHSGNEKAYKEFGFEVEGSGLYNYYVSGIADGTWQVLVDGVNVAYTLSSDESGLLTFIAPAGEVRLVPGRDVIGTNGGKIQYSTGGATMPEDTPYSYNNETTTVLPANPVRGEDVFLGWYLSTEFLPEERVTEVPVGYTGTFKVYAKWLSIFVNESYNETTLSVPQSNHLANGINYCGNGKPESLFKTYTDGNGRNYLEWIEGSSDSFINAQSTSSNIATAVSDDRSVSYTLELSPKPGAPNIVSSFQIIAKHDVVGNEINANTRIFTTNASGDVLLGGSTKIAKLEEGVITTLKIALDFKYGQIVAYTEDDEYLASIPLTIPPVTGATTTLELQKCYRQYLFYWHGDSDPAAPDSAIRIYKIKMQDGNVFEGSGGPITERSIVYEKNGGRMSKDTPYEYSRFSPTFLPDPVRAGYAFLGWYTTENFEEGTRVAYVPTSTREAFYVYAKWKFLPVTETYEGKEFFVPESNSGSNGQISYNAGSAGEPKPGSSFATEVDDLGNTYLVASVGSVNAIFYHANSNYNLTNFSETAISYSVDLKKLEGVPFPKISFNIATSKGAYGQLQVFYVDKDGNVRLRGSDKVFATVGEDEYTTVRVTVDFAAATFTAYDEEGVVLDTVSDRSVPTGGTAENQPTTLLEWQRVAANYLMYAALNSGDTAQGSVFSVAVDNIAIGEGNVFAKETVKGTVIKYKTNGGELVGAPLIYDPENGTDLSSVIPVREGYVFDGWYTASTLDESSRVTAPIGIGCDSMIVLYAKWHIRPDTIFYEPNGAMLPEDSAKYYDPVNGTVLPTDMHLDGFVFDGWYLNSDFSGDPVDVIGVGGDAPITVYAKWKLPPDKLIFETGGGTLPEGTPDKYDPVNGTALPTDIVREHYIFDGWYLDPDFAGEQVTVVGVGGEEPITVYAKWTLPNNKIFYETNGGEFATEPKTEYASEDGFVLPTDIARDGYVFGGWYTDPDFKSERITYIYYGSTDGFVVYAKWLMILVDENYDSFKESPTEVKGITTTSGQLSYNAINAGAKHNTVTDESGNTYIVTTISENKNAVIFKQHKTHNFTHFDETAVSYVFDVKKLKDVPLALASLSVQTNGGTAGSASLANISDKDGSVTLANSSVVIANVGEEGFTTLRITLDFADGRIYAFDESGNVLDSVELKVPSKYYSALEWQKVASEYIFYVSISKNIADESCIAFDNITVVEGRLFEKTDDVLPPKNGITYEANEGEMPEGAPELYDPENGTDIAGIVPERYGYRFLGWFDNADLDGEPITLAGLGEKAPITLYAKWEIIRTTINYEPNGGTLPENAPSYYDPENGTDMSGVIPTLAGFDFGGWYYDEELSEPATLVGIGADDPITLYAKWVIPAGEIRFEANGGEFVSEPPSHFDPIDGFVLPLDIVKNGFVFAGWYSDPELTSPIDYIPYGATEGYAVYAKWLTVMTDEDYSDKDFMFTSGQTGVDGITYNAQNNNGVTVKTVDDGENKYLYVETASTPNSVIRTTDSVYNINTLKEDAISFELDVGVPEGVIPSIFSWQLASSSSVGGTGTITIVTSDRTGAVKLVGSSKIFGMLSSESFLRIRIGVDFIKGTVTAYDADGNVLDSVTPSAPAGFSSLAEWQRAENGLKHHILFLSINRNSDAASGVASALLLDNIKITDGNIFRTFRTEMPPRNTLGYEADGGTLPEGAPELYDPENGTDLSTVIPEKQGYTFLGWYDNAKLDGEPITNVGKDGTVPVTVYAKWKITTNTIIYNTSGGTLPVDAPYYYDEVNGTELPTELTRSGYIFGGWYTTAELAERVYSIPADYGKPFEVYAKWYRAISNEDYESYKNNGFTVSGNTANKGTLSYNANNTGMQHETCADESGNTYLKTTVGGTSNAVIYRSDGSYNLTHFTETAISYEFDVKKLAGENLSAFRLIIVTSNSNANGELTLLNLNSAGELKLAGSSQVFANVNEDGFTKIRLTLDFAASTVSAYGADGELLDSSTLEVPKKNDVPVADSLAEWQKIAANYMFYLSMTGNGSAIAFDNFKVIEGRPFATN